MNQDCELPGCPNSGAEKKSIGRFQVWDGEKPTMSRPAELCQTCHDFAKTCGMEPRRVPMGVK